MINLKKILYLNCIVILLAGCGTLSDVGKAMKNEKTKFWIASESVRKSVQKVLPRKESPDIGRKSGVAEIVNAVVARLVTVPNGVVTRTRRTPRPSFRYVDESNM